MNKKNIWVMVFVLIIIFAVITFQNKSSDTKSKIGIIAPLTGDFSFAGKEVLDGVKDSLGDKYEIVVEDDACEPAKAVSAFKKLTEIDGADFIIGPACGSPQEAIAPIAKDSDVIVILPSAASRSLFEASGGAIFNVQYSLEEEGKFIAEKMNEAGYKNVGLVTYNNAFSVTTSKSFKENFKGGITELNYIDFSSDILPEITKNKNANMDALFVADLSFFFNRGLERLNQNGVNLPVYGQYTAELPFAIPFVEGVTYSFPKDVTGERGAIYELSKISAQTLSVNIEQCNGRIKCVKENLIKSGVFNNNGIRNQEIILKKIVGGKASVEL